MVIIYMVMLVPVVVGFVSLGVDFGHVQVVKQELEHASEAAARAAVSQLAGGVTTVQNTAVTWGAKDYADGSPVVIDPNNDVVFGTWTSGTRSFSVLSGAARSSANAIQVYARHTAARGTAVQLYFGGVIGIASCDTTASCIVTPGGTTISYPSGFAGASSFFNLNSSATVNGSNLQLSDGGTLEQSSAWFSTAQNITNFTTNFTFQVNNGDNTGCGITFTIQTDGSSAIGFSGHGYGYGSDTSGGTVYMPNSMCIVLGTVDGNSASACLTACVTGGAPPAYGTTTNLLPSSIDFRTGDVFAVQLTYNGTTLTETITDNTTHATFTQSYTINIPAIVGSNTAQVGFTGGTGGSHVATQNVLTWTYSSTAGSLIVQNQ